jgi:hypothetical protein
MHDAGTTTARQLAKLLREIPIDDQLANVVADLKTRAARLRIRWTPDAISEALRIVGSNRQIVRDTRPKPAAPERPIEPVILSRDEAAEVFNEILGVLDSAASVRQM